MPRVQLNLKPVLQTKWWMISTTLICTSHCKLKRRHTSRRKLLVHNTRSVMQFLPPPTYEFSLYTNATAHISSTLQTQHSAKQLTCFVGKQDQFNKNAALPSHAAHGAVLRAEQQWWPGQDTATLVQSSTLTAMLRSRGFTSLHTFRIPPLCQEAFRVASPPGFAGSFLLHHGNFTLPQNYKGKEKNPHLQDSTKDVFKTRRLFFSSIWKPTLPSEQQPYP